MPFTILSLFVLFSFSFAQYDPSSLILESVGISLQNKMDGLSISNFNITTQYGNLINEINPVELQYNEIQLFNYSTECKEGSVQTTISFQIHDVNRTISDIVSFTLINTPISYEYILPFGSYKILINQLSSNPYCQYQSEIYNIPNPKEYTNKEITLQQFTNDDNTSLNITICNNLPFGRAKLLAGTKYWGIPDFTNVPKQIDNGDCKSYLIHPACSGGIVGSYMTYISSGIERNLNIIIDPSGSDITTTRFARCIATSFYGNYPQVICSLAPESTLN